MIRAERIVRCVGCSHRIDRTMPCPYCFPRQWRFAIEAREAAEKAPRERGQRYRAPEPRPEQRPRVPYPRPKTQPYRDPEPRPWQLYQPPPATEPGPPYRPRPKSERG